MQNGRKRYFDEKVTGGKKASASAKQLCAELSEASASAKQPCMKLSEASANAKQPCVKLSEASASVKQPCAEQSEASASIGQDEELYPGHFLFPVAGRHKSYWSKCQPPQVHLRKAFQKF